ncbi:MAG TPA: DUF2652 domain-containing protein [Anaerolineae bacterium]|nr:DUF2652 domain-containing protein [Anaerolineae bacterium]
MEIKPAFLVIADISGYTRFLQLHTMSLLHAEQIITELLETVIDAAEHPLQISKLEGDAVFLYALAHDDKQSAAHDIWQQAHAFFTAFQEKAQMLIACNECPCDACHNIGQLKLKVVMHYGEVAIKRIRQFEELAGRDVILVHRLMKNSITVREYILMTTDFQQFLQPNVTADWEERSEHVDDLGPVPILVYYPQHHMSTPQPNPDGHRLAQVNRLTKYSVARLRGKEEERPFNNLPTDTSLSWRDYIQSAIKTIWWNLRQKRPS